MLTSEFFERTGYQPTREEWAAIEEAYYFSDADKDTFCRAWKIANRDKVEAAERVRRKYAERARMEERVFNNVLRFVRAPRRECATSGAEFWSTAGENLERVLGRYYRDTEARDYLRRIRDFAGAARFFETSRCWSNYWHLFNAVSYGL